MSGPVPCPSCGQPVPLGRLACPSCGALVASVSRVEPRVVAPEPDVAEAIEAEPEAIEAEPEAIEAGPETVDAEPETVDAGLGTLADDVPPETDPERISTSEPEAEPAPAPEPAMPPAPWPEIEARPVIASIVAPIPLDESIAADGIASGGIVPGSYLPPSTVHRAGSVPPGGGYLATPAPGGPATWAPPAPATSSGGWVPHTPGAVGTAAAGAASVTPSAAASATTIHARDGRPSTPGRASVLADLPFDAPDELEGWLVALGGGMGVLGFFLPWSAAIGEGLEGYLGSWGLGVASRLPVFFLLVVVSALAILPNRVATWVRTGVCGMVAGGILLGLVWLYLGSDASQLGALLASVGAVLLIAGGIIAVAPGRSADHREDA